MDGAKSISVEVVYAGEGALFFERVSLPAGSTLADAVRASGFTARFPAVTIGDDNVGVFSRKVGMDHVLADDDRVEIYRPLKLSPNEARKLRAARRGAKASRSGG